MKKMIALVVLSALCAAPVFAANEGFYAGLNIGSGNPGIDSSNGIDKKSSVAGGGLVGYQFTQHFALEGQATTIGKVTDLAGGTAKGYALGVSGVGFLPLNNDFSLFGKLGVAETRTSVSDAFPTSGASRFAPTVGVGMQYAVSAVALRLGWDHYGAATEDAGGSKINTNANVVTVGAVYKF